MSEPVNVSPGTRFDEATPGQFREFWEAQGWEVRFDGVFWCAERATGSGIWIHVEWLRAGGFYLSVADSFQEQWVEFLEFGAVTLGKALRYANNLAQAELFGGWAE